MSKSSKPTAPVRLAKPATKEDKELQVARYLANEKKTYFNIILSGLVQNGTHPKQAVDLAIEAADYALEKLYNAEKKED